jgi:hypothetical protein
MPILAERLINGGAMVCPHDVRHISWISAFRDPQYVVDFASQMVCHLPVTRICGKDSPAKLGVTINEESLFLFICRFCSNCFPVNIWSKTHELYK